MSFKEHKAGNYAGPVEYSGVCNLFVAKWGLPVRIGGHIDGSLDSLSCGSMNLTVTSKNKRVEQIRLLDICETYEVTPQVLSGFLFAGADI